MLKVRELSWAAVDSSAHLVHWASQLLFNVMLTIWLAPYKFTRTDVSLSTLYWIRSLKTNKYRRNYSKKKDEDFDTCQK